MPTENHNILRSALDAGIITFRTDHKDLSALPTSLSIRSVPTPLKFSVNQWQGGSTGHIETHAVLTYTSPGKRAVGQAGAVYLLQQISGCRVGEALGLRTTDIMLPDQLIIRALKKSRSRIIRVPELSDQLTRLKGAGDHRLFNISYQQVYRYYKARGIMVCTPKGRNNRVTHSLRYAFAQSVQDTTKTLETTRDVIGHKSRKSTIIYLERNNDHG